MPTLTERNIEIGFPPEVKARKFDDSSHGLPCMKAVDFVVECPDRCLFIEIKDPEDPRATATQRKEFLTELHSGRLDTDLKYKYRDSFLYEWAKGNDAKPIYYYVIIAIASLSTVELLHRTDELKRKLPVYGPRSGTWKRQFVTDCAVFNIKMWNEYQPRFPLSRI